MLSILIPTHNYAIFNLVSILNNQCLKLKIKFEIIVLDDASNELFIENNEVNKIENCSYLILEKNIGRSAIRNLLAKKAKYENLLFLDADTLPNNDNFISNYISNINLEEKIIYGGILYQKEKPVKAKVLRWVYGNSREALSVNERNKKPYLSFLTLNFLIKKSIFEKVLFNENIPNFRHEDTLFSYNLMKKNIKIEHIVNPVLHLGIDFTDDFIKKSEQALENLNFLILNKLIDYDYVKIASFCFLLKKFKIQSLISYLFENFKKSLLKNCKSSNPSLFLFDLYRIGYFCNFIK